MDGLENDMVLELGGFGSEAVNLEDDWDDRVLCLGCVHRVEVDRRQSMPADQMEKHRKVNAKPLRWMFDAAKIRNGWATVTWKEWECKATGLPSLPVDLKHRCHLHCTSTEAAQSVKSDAWWMD